MSGHLRAWRKNSGRTLQQVAAVLGTTHTTILRYERGDMKPTADMLRRLAEVYGCLPAELQYDPSERDRGRRMHEAIEILAALEPELAERWLEIGRLLKPAP